MKKITILLFHLFIGINFLYAQFPNVKGKESSGLIPFNQPKESIDEYGIKYELGKERLEFNISELNIENVNSSKVKGGLTGITNPNYHDNYDYYPGRQGTINQHDYQFAVGLKDFSFNLFDSDFQPEYELNYSFSRSVDRTSSSDKVEKAIIKERDMKISNDPIYQSLPESKKKNYKDSVHVELIDKLKQKIRTLSFSPVLNIKKNTYAAKNSDILFNKKKTWSVDFGTNIGVSWLKDDYKYGAKSGFALTGYLGHRSNSISNLRKKEFCQVEDNSNTLLLDTNRVVLQSCTELLTGDPDEKFEFILKIDHSIRLFTPSRSEKPSYSIPALFLISRLQHTTINNRRSNDWSTEWDIFTGLSLAKSNRQILGTIFFKLRDIFKDRNKNDFSETPIVEATIGIPIGGG